MHDSGEQNPYQPMCQPRPLKIPLTKNRCVPAPGAGHEAVDGAAPESCGLRRRHTWPDEKLYFCISDMGCGAWRLDKFSRSLFDGRLTPKPSLHF